jgi:hypothetical protein
MSSRKFAPRTAIAALLAAMAIVVLSAHLIDYRLRYHDPAFSYYWYWASGYARGNVEIWRDCSYPPPFLAMFVPITWLDPRYGWWTWQVLQIGSLATALMLVLREREGSLDWNLVVIGLSLSLLFPPTLGSLYDAQPTPLLLLLLLLAWINSRHGRPAIAGFCLAAAAMLKLYPAAVGGYFLFRRRWREIVWAALGVAIIVPVTGLHAWYGALFLGAPFYLNSQFWMGNERAVSLLQNACALVDRIGLSPPDRQALGPAVAIALVADVVVVVVAARLSVFADAKAEADGFCFALWLLVLPLLSPVAWSQYSVVALPAYLLAALKLRPAITEGRAWRGLTPSFTVGTAMLLISIFAFIVPAFWGVLRSIHVYFVGMVASYVGAALCLWSLGGSSCRSHQAFPNRLRILRASL